MAGGITIIDRDNGYKALVTRLDRASAGPYVTIGVHEEQGSASYADGATVAEIATFNEFGMGVPRRSFLVDWADENEAAHKEEMRKVGKAVIDGRLASVEQGLERLGLKWVGDVQQRIKAGIEPENAPSTIARKGSSTPLIDKGLLWTSIRHKVNAG